MTAEGKCTYHRDRMGRVEWKGNWRHWVEVGRHLCINTCWNIVGLKPNRRYLSNFGIQVIQSKIWINLRREIGYNPLNCSASGWSHEVTSKFDIGPGVLSLELSVPQTHAVWERQELRQWPLDKCICPVSTLWWQTQIGEGIKGFSVDPALPALGFASQCILYKEALEDAWPMERPASQL